MSAVVALAVLGSALVHASWNAMIKAGASPLDNSFALSVSWIVIGALALPFVDAPATASWGLLGASAVVHVVYFWLLAYAYQVADLSRIYPIARGLPPALIYVASAVVTDDGVPHLGALGVFLISAGILVQAGGGLTHSARRSVALAVGIAAFISTYTLLDGLGARATGSVSFIVWLTFIHGSLFVVLSMALRGVRVVYQRPRQFLRGAVSGALASGGYAVVLWAMTVAPIALVAALRETAVLFATAIGILVLREPFGRRRMLGAALIVAGACIIQLRR